MKSLSLMDRTILAEARAIMAQRRKEAKAARPRSPKADRGRVRDNPHLAFIRRLPCACCRKPGPNDAAHLRVADAARGKPYTGKGVKPDDKWSSPLCRACHERQHSGSEAAFWSALFIDPIILCKRLYAVSGDYDAGVAVILSYGESQ